MLDPRGFLCEKNTTTIRENFFVRCSQLSNFTQTNDRFSIVGIRLDNYAETRAVKIDYISANEASNNINTDSNSVTYLLPKNTTDNLFIYKVPVTHIGSAYNQLLLSDENCYQLLEFCINGLQLKNITQIHGRAKKQDKIFLTEEIKVVDTYEGENEKKPDYIYITERASKNLTIVLRPNTIVNFRPKNSTVNLISYKIPARQLGNAYLELPFNRETSHRLYFESSVDELEALNIKNDTIYFQFRSMNGRFNVIIQNTEASLTTNASAASDNSFFIQSASYIFNKTLEMKFVNEKLLYTQWHGNTSVNEIVQAVAPMAHRIDKAIVVQASQNETIAIGSRQQEILSTDGSVVNHLVGNAGDTVYVIQIPKNRTDPFPLSDISLHNLENNSLEAKTTINTLDLRKVFKKAYDQCEAQSILPVLEENKDDLILTLYTNYYFSASGDCVLLSLSSNPMAKILFKNIQNNFWFQDMDIILDERSMNIIYDEVENKWKLVPIPLTITSDKNIITITDKDIKQNDEIIILKNSGDYEFKRHNDTDLLLTNMFNNVNETELYTVLFSQFFQNPLFKTKILSLNLTFLDEALSLREYVQEINNAADFDRQLQSYFNESVYFFSNLTTSLSRKRREISIMPPISSGSSRVTPDIYGLFIYIPLKILPLASYILNRFYQNINNLNYLTGKGFVANKKIKDSIGQSEAGKNQLILCNKNNIFAEGDCVKNQSALGLLVYCANPKQGVTWFIDKTAETNTPTVSWFATIDNGISRNTSDNLHILDINLSMQTDYVYFYNKDGCQQGLNLSKVSNTSVATLFLYLPEEGQRWLLGQWYHEKLQQDKLQQDELAMASFKQQLSQVGLNYIGNSALLHTSIGDYFQAMGFRPNWHERDPNYFLARWLSALQQWRLGGTNQTLTMAAALLETAILHPRIQSGYSFLWPNTKMRYKKQAIRLCADLFQWGSLNFALMPSLLEMLFPNYPHIDTITWGLRASLSFYMVNNDSSYYYLGIALFFLPQLPLLLEHMGIPVTAYISKALEKLTRLFIFQSLLELKPTPDQSRLIQHSIELKAAEQRVARGSARISAAVKPLVSFFKPPVQARRYSHEKFWPSCPQN